MRLIDADKFLSQIEDQYMEHDITRSQYMDLEDRIMQQPTVVADGWLERNKDEILRAGYEGREVEFRIGGRMFMIREVPQ